MSKEELYNSLNPKDDLSRNILDDHLSGKKTLHSEHLDEFDQEAIEGWQSTGAAGMDMTKLDARFNSNSSKLYIYFGVVSLFIAVGLVFFLSKDAKQNITTTNQNDTEALVEETDLYIAEKYDTLVELAESNQIEIKILQKKQEDQPVIKKEEKIVVPFLNIDKLPALEIKINEKTPPTVISNKRKIKEVYLSGFKLVDYRTIRSKPVIETKQLDLTGTAANHEDTNMRDDEPIWRKVDVPYHDFIEKSMYLLNKGDLKKALVRFDLILVTYSDDVNALFYSGFALYNLGEYEKATQFFAKALNNNIANFDDEAAWYLGLSFEKQGKNTQAKEIFSSIANSNSFYSSEAKKKLK